MKKEKSKREEANEKAAAEFTEFMKQAYEETIDYKYSRPIINVLFWAGAAVGFGLLCKIVTWVIEYINYKNPMGF